MFVGGVYKIFSDESFYSDSFYQFYHQFFVGEISDYMIENFNVDLDEMEFRSLVEDAISDDDLKVLFNDVKGQMLETDLNNSDKLLVNLPVAKTFANNPHFYPKLSDLIYGELPDCIEEEVYIDDSGKFICLPENFSNVDLEANVQSILDRGVFSNIPNQLNINLPLKINGTLANFLNDSFDSFIFFSALFLFILLGIIAVLIFSPVSLIGRWMAKAFFFASLSLGLFSIVMKLVPNWIFIDNENLYSFYDATLGVVSSYLLYSYAIPICVLSLFAWILIRHYYKD